jgi:hypothetical protein
MSSNATIYKGGRPQHAAIVIPLLDEPANKQRRLSFFYEAEACAVREQFWAITTTPTTIKLNDTRHHVNTVSEMSMQVRSANGPGIARSWCV